MQGWVRGARMVPTTEPAKVGAANGLILSCRAATEPCSVRSHGRGGNCPMRGGFSPPSKLCSWADPEGPLFAWLFEHRIRRSV